MSEQAPAPPPRNHSGLIGGIVAQSLAYMDKPWKALVLVVLIIFGGLGWVAYSHQDELIEAWLTPSSIELKISDIPEALTKLGEETSADLVQIWEVDLSTNSQRFIAARRHDGERPVIPSPRRLPIIVTVSDVRALEHVLDGRPVCVPITEFGSPLARRLAERGMTRGCAIPIPPSAQKFLGVIYLAWTKAVDETAENVAVGAAREIAAQLVSR
jgi:hypothetical protein